MGRSLLLVAVGLVACGGAVEAPSDPRPSDDGPLEPPAADDDPPPPLPASPFALGSLAARPEWLRVDAVLAASALPAYTFETYRLRGGEPELVYSRSAGGQARTTPLKIASASKTITAAAVLHAVIASDNDALELTTRASVLGNPAGVCANLPEHAARITLSELLHQTSGIAEVGAVFRYGANNFTVAAAIVEAMMQEDWYHWFDRLRAAYGLDSDAIDYAVYSNGEVRARNSNLAGGVVSSAMAYAPFLQALAPGGPVARAYAEPFDDEISIAVSPFAAFGLPVRYGLGNWSTCVLPWAERSASPNGDYSFLTLDYVGL